MLSSIVGSCRYDSCLPAEFIMNALSMCVAINNFGSAMQEHSYIYDRLGKGVIAWYWKVKGQRREAY